MNAITQIQKTTRKFVKNKERVATLEIKEHLIEKELFPEVERSGYHMISAIMRSLGYRKSTVQHHGKTKVGWIKSLSLIHI